MATSPSIQQDHVYNNNKRLSTISTNSRRSNAISIGNNPDEVQAQQYHQDNLNQEGQHQHQLQQHQQNNQIQRPSTSHDTPRAEVFVIVRPPPSSIKHPLNLQVQLITSTRRNRNNNTSNPPSRRTSVEFSRSNTDVSSFNAVAEASVGLGGSNTSSSNVATSQQLQQQNSQNSANSGTGIGTGRHSPVPPPRAPSLSRSSSYGPASGDQQDPNLDTPLMPGGGGGDLSRSASVRSTRSTASYASSTASGGSGMRKVTPCYNLEFHSLQSTVVTDAGTDARIAKIHKKGVEMLDFATLDPVFLHQAGTIPTLAQREEAHKAAEQARPSTSSGGGSEFVSSLKPATNLLNRFKRFSFRSSSNSSNSSNPPVSAGATPEKKGGGLFSPIGSPASTSFAAAQQQALAVSDIPVVPLFREKSPGPGASSSIEAGTSSDDLSTNNPGSRTSISGPRGSRHAVGYTWIVRQYLRKDLDGKQQDVCDVSFEWRKTRKRHRHRHGHHGQQHGQRERGVSRADSRRHSTHSNYSTTMESSQMEFSPSKPQQQHLAPPTSVTDSPSRTSRSFDLPRPNDNDANSLSPTRQPHQSATSIMTASDGNSNAADLLSPNRLARPRTAGSIGGGGRGRSTPDGSRSRSPNNASNSDIGHGSGIGYGDEDDDEPESDPEDSERPWICELILRRPSSTTSQRILLGTLTPAPHHPKLVAHIAIPSSLTPINVSLGAHQQQGSSPSEINTNTINLSIEELKDVMTVTALWLVVRENLGLGSVNKVRKGDGAWRFTTPAALKSG